MINRILLIAIVLLSCLKLSAQTGDSIPNLRSYHEALKIFNDSLVNAISEENRSAASMQMIKTFSRALRLTGSDEYIFDELPSVAILQPEDKAFRIFTWQLSFDNGTNRYFGVIQMKGATPKLYPLVDYGSFYENPDSIIVDHDRWIGALYYNIFQVKAGKKNFYMLFGWNGNNLISNKKLIDILWFDEDGTPKFGYPLFAMSKGESPSRIIFEYKKDAIMSLTHMPEENSIYYDHLTQLGGKSTDFKFDQVPDGTLEGFVWEKGKWQQIDNIEYQKREDGDVPNVVKEQTIPLYRPLPPR